MTRRNRKIMGVWYITEAWEDDVPVRGGGRLESI